MKPKTQTSVQSIERGLTILEALSGEKAGLGLTELARRTRLPVSTVHRLISVFVRRGYVRREGGRGSYRLDSRFLGLGFVPVHLYRDIQRLAAERFLPRFAAGEIGEIFVKISERSIGLRRGGDRVGEGVWLVPEVLEPSDRVCPWIMDSPGPERCEPLEGGVEGALFRPAAGSPAWCTCVPVPREFGACGLESIGVRGPDGAGGGSTLPISAELMALGGDLGTRLDGHGKDRPDATQSDRREQAPRGNGRRMRR